MCRGLFFDEVAGLNQLLFPKSRRCFSLNFVKILRIPFLQPWPQRVFSIYEDDEKEVGEIALGKR